ncbi:MAG: glycosyltransferase family 2 protein [Gemmatimonadota bacterium]
MASPPHIVGIALLRNEEHFVTWVLRNVVDFCDELIVLDNQSTDRTPDRIAEIADAFPNVTVHECPDPNTSQKYIEHYAGERVWVFGVDGDEVYDPAGLARLRPRLLSGEFDGAWRLDGHALNAVRVDLDAGYAEGHAVPATPPGTKLYNFAAIDSWHEPEKQRLHGHRMVFRPGFSKTTVHPLYEDEDWSGADLRLLHLCFFPRTPSSEISPAKRPNPSFVKARGLRRGLIHLQNFLARPFSSEASYKTRRYARGPLVRRDIAAFGRPRDFSETSPAVHQAESVLRKQWMGSGPHGRSTSIPGMHEEAP